MNGKIFSLAMSALNTFFIFRTLKTISYGAHRMVWGGMTGSGLTSLHFIPKVQAVTAEYYVTKILEKEVKPLFSRRSTTEEPVKRKLFTNNSSATFVQDALTPLKTYGASSTKLHTEIRSLRQ